MKKLFSLGLLAVVLFFNLACAGMFSTNVPPGYKGMVMHVDGLSGKLLEPGWHTCWGRDRMVLIDESDTATNEKLSILCQDDLNFQLDLEMRSSIKFDNPKGLTDILRKQGSKIQWKDSVGYLTYTTIYNTYVKQIARSITRTVVAQYSTVQIRDAREEIQNTIKEKILKATANLPVKISMVVTNNFDYPDIITEAVERKKQRELELEAERARLEMDLNRMDNKLRLEEKRKTLLQAQANNDAVRMNILKDIITPEFIALRETENQQLLIEQIAEGKVGTVILNGSDSSLTLPVGK